MCVFCFQQIVISSGAASPFHVRGPYDVVNLYPSYNFGWACYGTSHLNHGCFIYATLKGASIWLLLH
jgi:hypothetical protein